MLTLLKQNVSDVDIKQTLMENTQMKMKLKISEGMLSKTKKDVKDLKFVVDQQKMQMVNTTRKTAGVRKKTGFKF